MTETKAEKFNRLADARLPKIIHSLSLLENLNGPSYESTPEQRLAIIESLDAAVDQVAEAFGVGKPAEPLTDTKELAENPSPPRSGNSAEVIEADICPSTSGSAHDQITLRRDGHAEGGSIAVHEVRWAYDAVMRKDWKLAAERLHRILTVWEE